MRLVAGSPVGGGTRYARVMRLLLKKKIIAALLFSFLIASSTSGYVSAPIQPVSREYFSEVSLPLVTPLPTILEGITNTVPSSRPKIKLAPSSKVVVTPKSVTLSKPVKKYVSTGHSAKGLASWYCSFNKPICRVGYGPGTRSAAAGPALRAAIGGSQSSPAYRNKTVKVCGSTGCMNVKLVDWCQCYYKKSNEKLIDLYKIVFDAVGASKGTVTVSW